MVSINQEPIYHIFQAKLSELKNIIEKNNVLGNVNGLFSQYVIGSEANMSWAVNVCDDWLSLHTEVAKGSSYVGLAVVGYSLSAGIQSERIVADFTTGVVKLSIRNPFPNDKITFAYYPREFLGIILGINSLENSIKEKQKKWLIDVLSKRKADSNISSLQRRIYNFLESTLLSKNMEVTSSEIENSSYAEICLIYWGYKKGAFSLNDLTIVSKIQQKVLKGFFEETISSEEWTLPIIYFSVKSCLLESINQIIISTDNVTRLLENFESALRRWPDKENHHWSISDEKDIQSMLWLILRSIFNDVIDEDPSPKFGHRFSIVDFRIPSLSLLVEAKYIRRKADFVGIENEIKVDSIDYLRTIQYREMIVFIFDESASVQEHQITISALEKIPGVRKVIIASMPSNLKPFVTQKNLNRKKK